ncbi:MAG: ABC transporter ATP-binding protein [Clostridiales bacterium]|nr:ABC transporter ATP-binding protein [Clostridiales bacterium]
MEENRPAIIVDNVTIRFNLASERVDNLKDYVIKFLKRELFFEEFFALKNVSFTVQKGEAWGIVGRNGSGKSTLLKVISGVLKPYKGRVKVEGSIAPLLELGAGFDPDMTGRENVFLNGLMLGQTKAFLKENYQAIVDFAEIEKFMDVPLKNYSSGMRARLGFSIATAVQPEILIVDEVLGTGDKFFQEKCEQRIHGMLETGTTLLYVSHSPGSVRELCDHAIWLKDGEAVMVGEANEVCDAYEQSETL